MRVAPINHHWWYDQWLSILDPLLVGHIQVDWSTEPHGSGQGVSLVIFLNISKAFDTVNHQILLKKLNLYGVTGKNYFWFQNYLKS